MKAHPITDPVAKKVLHAALAELTEATYAMPDAGSRSGDVQTQSEETYSHIDKAYDLINSLLPGDEQAELL